MTARTRNRPPAYNAGVPWTSSHQLMTPRTGGTLFRGFAPGYLRLAYLRAGLPVDVPSEPLILAIVRDREGSLLDPPIAVYELAGEAWGRAGGRVFAASGRGPKLHVDARYLVYAETRFSDVTFWRVSESIASARNERDLMGIVDGRDLLTAGRDS